MDLIQLHYFLPSGYKILERTGNTLHVQCCNNHYYKISYTNLIKSHRGCKICIQTTKKVAAYEKLGYKYINTTNGDDTIECLNCGSTKTLEFRYRNDRALCLPCYYKKMRNDNKKVFLESLDPTFKLISEYINTDEPATFQCQHGHTFKRSPYSMLKLKSCPLCINSSSIRKYNYKEVLKSKGWEYISGEYENYNSLIAVSCKNNHIIEKPFHFHLYHGCKQCANDALRKWDENSIEERLKSDRPHIRLISVKFGKNSISCQLQCSRDFHQWTTGWYDFVSNNRDCPKCVGNAPISHISIRNGFEKYGYSIISEIHPGVETKLEAKCPEGHTFSTTYHRFWHSGSRCPICIRGMSSSKWETEIVTWLESNDFKVDKSDRKQIYPFEIDAYLPDFKVGLEFNGLYYHSMAVKKDSQYHYKKYKLANDNGVQLIQFWEDEWYSRPDVVKSMILAKTNKHNFEKVYARNCHGREIPRGVAIEFLAVNHLQLSSTFSKAYGLFNNESLVAVATIGSHRTDKTKIVLNRYAVKKYTNVIGGFSKLLQHLPRPLITYSDNRYSNGGLYNATGFILDANIRPTHEFFKNSQRYSKRALENKFSTNDIQIYKQNGYIELYDAGKKRWVLY